VWLELERGTIVQTGVSSKNESVHTRLPSNKKLKIGKGMNRISTSYGFASTAEEVAQGVRLSGQRAIVTGGASGIGIETARVLAAIDADVTLAVRNLETGEKAAAEITALTGNKNVHASLLDLSYFESVNEFTRKWAGPLHILINNAGIMATPEQRTAEGYESQFATNYLGHFALALGLHKSLAQAEKARVVCVSSMGHLYSPVVFDDIHFRFRPYDPLLAYAQSKTAVNLFAAGAGRRWAGDGITVNALNPGAIKTNLQRHVGGTLKSPPHFHKTIQQGAATSIFLALSPLVEGISGRYFENCNEAVPVSSRPAQMSESTGIFAPYSLDAGNADRLWEESLRSI
jgi:NAD(P)-dependent dehydrogenase (short-subunit alcohol dehydrogenase family)